jgi:DNA modification methylase
MSAPLETGVLYCDDNLQRLAQFPPESVDLIYLDPPFFSNRTYEVIWGDEAEVRSFEDRWQGGINVYINWMRERVMEMHRVLKATGSIYLHCDWHASAYLRVMLDEVFGANRFQNEIVWWYRGGGVSPKRWGRRHDTILFYSKGNKWTFNVDPVRTAYSPDSQERLKYKARAFRGDKVYDNYEANPLGKHPDDVFEIQPVMPSSKMRLGYPTQKPPKLMERILLASSNPGDVVLDPFAGCGMSLIAAHELKRRWVGIDISPTAVELMKRQLSAAGVLSIKTVGLPVTEQQLRSLKPFEFQNWVINRFNGVHSSRKSGDMGIDGYSFLEHLPIQVKQSSGVGRETVDSFQTAVRRNRKTKGYIVAFGFTSGAHEEAARSRQAGIKIELVKVADLLTDKSKLVTPTTSDLFQQLPLPEPRPADSRPSLEQLIESARKPATVTDPTPRRRTRRAS